jgi:hypothetical protein
LATQRIEDDEEIVNAPAARREFGPFGTQFNTQLH